MKLLLDTHIWIWSFLEPKKIAPRVAKLLENPAIEKWLSPISIWEFIVLVEKGRNRTRYRSPDVDRSALKEFPPREAPLTTEVVLALPGIQLKHRDRADAFLMATAKVFELTLVTADYRLFAVKGVSTPKPLTSGTFTQITRPRSLAVLRFTGSQSLREDPCSERSALNSAPS